MAQTHLRHHGGRVLPNTDGSTTERLQFDTSMQNRMVMPAANALCFRFKPGQREQTMCPLVRLQPNQAAAQRSEQTLQGSCSVSMRCKAGLRQCMPAAPPLVRRKALTNERGARSALPLIATSLDALCHALAFPVLQRQLRQLPLRPRYIASPATLSCALRAAFGQGTSVRFVAAACLTSCHSSGGTQSVTYQSQILVGCARGACPAQ
jgi:hypothetical protein